MSIGPLAQARIGTPGTTDYGNEGKNVEVGDIVVFDHYGGRETRLSAKDAELVIVHAGQLFFRMHVSQLEARKMPIPD